MSQYRGGGGRGQEGRSRLEKWQVGCARLLLNNTDTALIAAETHQHGCSGCCSWVASAPRRVHNTVNSITAVRRQPQQAAAALGLTSVVELEKAVSTGE